MNRHDSSNPEIVEHRRGHSVESAVGDNLHWWGKVHALIVSSSPTPAGLAETIEAGLHPRLDYLELAGRQGAEYVDFNIFQKNTIARRFENKLRLDFRQAFWVARRVLSKKYRAVLAMSERVAIPLAVLLPRSVKQVVIGHHLLSPQKLRFIRWMGLYRRWDRIIIPTKAELQVLERTLRQSNRLERIPFPVDTAFFKPRPTVQVMPSDHVMSLGLSYRDYPTLIEALRQIPEIACQIRIGSSWVSGDAGIDQETLPQNTKILPYVPLPELLHSYERCRFVVIPVCRTTQLSAGSISVLLAQAMGRPVIATCTPGMPDYVLEHETGLLVEAGNPEKMAEAIQVLWNRPDDACAMGKHAREWVADTFSMEKWVTRISGVLSELE